MTESMAKTAKAKKAKAKPRTVVRAQIDIRIKAVGGLYNGEYVGRAFDGLTGLRLVHLVKLAGGHAVLLSGMGLNDDGMHAEMSIEGALKEFIRPGILAKNAKTNWAKIAEKFD